MTPQLQNVEIQSTGTLGFEELATGFASIGSGIRRRQVGISEDWDDDDDDEPFQPDSQTKDGQVQVSLVCPGFKCVASSGTFKYLDFEQILTPVS